MPLAECQPPRRCQLHARSGRLARAYAAPDPHATVPRPAPQPPEKGTALAATTPHGGAGRRAAGTAAFGVRWFGQPGRGAEDPDLLGQQPGRQPRGRQADPPARAGQVRASRPASRSSVEVVPWSDLLNRLLAAATSGQGPDVVNIGNTWSASLQATGAFIPFDDATLDAVGGKDRFVAGGPGRRRRAGPAARRPCRSTAWRTPSTTTRRCSPTRASPQPPTTWERARRRRQEADQRTSSGAWRSRAPTSRRTSTTRSPSASSTAASGSTPPASRPSTRRRTSPPSSGTSTSWPSTRSSTRATPSTRRTSRSPTSPTARPAMLLWQAAGSALKAQGMAADDYGVAPVPFLASPPGRRQAGQQHGRRHQHRGLQAHQEPGRARCSSSSS